MIPAEHWRDVPGYEGLYQVSDRGKVRNSLRRIVTSTAWGNRHMYVALHAAGRRRYVSVSRLVLTTFDRPPRPGEIARHFPDTSPANNRLDNLQWACTQYHGAIRRGSQRPQAKLTEADIPTIRRAFASGTPVSQIAEQYGVSAAAIHAVVTGRTWRHC